MELNTPVNSLIMNASVARRVHLSKNAFLINPTKVTIIAYISKNMS